MSRRPGSTVHDRVGNRFEVDQRAALWGNRARGPAPNKDDDRKASMTASVIESQNDELITDLEGKVSRLKDITIRLGDEAKKSNSILKAFGLDFDNASALMKGTLGKLKVMVSKSGNGHMCYMMIFIVFLFFMMYGLRRLGGGSSRAVEVVQTPSASLTGVESMLMSGRRNSTLAP
mmetsp:Transcript_10340/g.14623  ORF Transcript_10340/g.14623 Transcript_10340/m.14623 type:complete len:176 (-) Transcript_10340:79-606(-)